MEHGGSDKLVGCPYIILGLLPRQLFEEPLSYGSYTVLDASDPAVTSSPWHKATEHDIRSVNGKRKKEGEWEEEK